MKPTRIWLITRVACAAMLLLTISACASGTAGTTQTDSGIQGTVTYGPTCPVQRVGGPSCVRRFSAEIAVRQGDHTVTTFRSAADGAFKVSLQPGTYTLTSTKSGLPFLRPLDVTVKPNAYTSVTVQFDSGIR
jgi:hypothetical protein